MENFGADQGASVLLLSVLGITWVLADVVHSELSVTVLCGFSFLFFNKACM